MVRYPINHLTIWIIQRNYLGKPDTLPNFLRIRIKTKHCRKWVPNQRRSSWTCVCQPHSTSEDLWDQEFSDQHGAESGFQWEGRSESTLEDVSADLLHVQHRRSHWQPDPSKAISIFSDRESSPVAVYTSRGYSEQLAVVTLSIHRQVLFTWEDSSFAEQDFNICAVPHGDIC